MQIISHWLGIRVQMYLLYALFFPSATVTHVISKIRYNLKSTITEMSEFDVLMLRSPSSIFAVTILAHNRLNREEVFYLIVKL